MLYKNFIRAGVLLFANREQGRTWPLSLPYCLSPVCVLLTSFCVLCIESNLLVSLELA